MARENTPKVNLELPLSSLPPAQKDSRYYKKNKTSVSFRNPSVTYPKQEVLSFEEL